MPELLLILVLFGNPASQAPSDALAGDLRLALGARAKVLGGAEAWAEAKRLGLTDGDLMAANEKPLALTRAAPLIVLRAEAVQAKGMPSIETAVWHAGHLDRHVAFHANDVEGRFRSGVFALVQKLIASRNESPADAADRLATPFLAKADWAGLLAALPESAARIPRHRLHAIRALLRIGDRDAAQVELKLLQTQAADSAEARTATELITNERAPETTDPPAPVDGGNVLR